MKTSRTLGSVLIVFLFSVLAGVALEVALELSKLSVELLNTVFVAAFREGVDREAVLATLGVIAVLGFTLWVAMLLRKANRWIEEQLSPTFATFIFLCSLLFSAMFIAPLLRFSN